MTESREDAVVLGACIGTMSGWDQLEAFVLLCAEFVPNEVGQKFIPDFKVEAGTDLSINFDSGVVSAIDMEGNETVLQADWSVFNQEWN